MILNLERLLMYTITWPVSKREVIKNLEIMILILLTTSRTLTMQMLLVMTIYLKEEVLNHPKKILILLNNLPLTNLWLITSWPREANTLRLTIY
jgi:hypothetical protein